MLVRARVLILATVYILGAARAPAGDCDGNGIDDAVEIAAGTASDCSGDGVLDVCELERPGPVIAPHGSFRLPLECVDLDVSDLDGDGRKDAAALAEDGLMIFRGAGGLRFTGPSVNRLELRQNSLASGDLDRDGDLELVTAASAEVNVLSKDASGSYIVSGRTVIGSVPFRIILADLDGDSFLDAATSNGDENVSILRGLGDGTFSQARNFLGNALDGIAAFDAEGDGDLDLGLSDTPGFDLLENDGRGFFSSPVGGPRCGIQGVTGASPGDLDGDGDIDLALLCGEGVSISSNERGRLGEPARLAGTGFNALTLLDLDGDRDLDILANSMTSFIGFRNDGRGVFQPFESPLGPSGGSNTSPADLDGDGVPEILTTGTVQGPIERESLLKVRDLRFSGADCNRNGIPDGCEEDCDGNGIPDSCDVEVFDCDLDGKVDACGPDANGNREPDACEAARGEIPDCNGNGALDSSEPDDWNENGIPDGCDLASGKDGDCNRNGIADGGDSRPILSFRSARAYGHFAADRFFCFGPASHAALDLDLDGRTDIVTLDCGSLRVLRNRGLRGLVDRWVETNDAGLLASGDLDGDGRLDLLAASEGTAPARAPSFTIQVLMADPEGHLHAIDTVEVSRRIHTWEGSSYAEYLHGFAAGDLYGDAVAEAVLLTERRLVVLEWRGPGRGFLERPLVEEFDYFRGERVELRDLDGDGDLDIDLGGITWENRAGFFVAKNISFSPPASPDAVPSLDLDGDGLLDSVEAASSKLLVHPGKLEGSGEPRAYPGGTPTAVDLDGDGDLDLAALDWAFDDAVLLLENEGGLFEETLRVFPGQGTLVSAGAADLDDDGDAEILARTDRGSFAVWNDGWSFRRAAEPLEFPISGLRLDVNGDGAPEWLADQGTTTRILEMTGALSFSVRAALTGAFLGSLDLEPDGDLDLATREGNEIRLWRNDGLGAFSNGGSLTPSDDLGGADIADLDGDGAGDLVLGLPGCFLCDADDGITCCDPELLVLANRQGAFERMVRLPLEFVPRAVVARDLDLDGDPDIAVAQTDDRRPDEDNSTALLFGKWVEVFVNRGRGAIEPWGALPCGEGPGTVLAEDVSGDGYPELIVHGIRNSITVIRNDTIAPTLHDADGDGIADECEAGAFRRGDWTGDGTVDISDPVSLLRHLFLGGAASPCAAAGDADDGGSLDLTDAVLVLDHLFQGGPPPATPFPSCGIDPTPDALGCEPASRCIR